MMKKMLLVTMLVGLIAGLAGLYSAAVTETAGWSMPGLDYIVLWIPLLSIFSAVDLAYLLRSNRLRPAMVLSIVVWTGLIPHAQKAIEHPLLRPGNRADLDDGELTIAPPLDGYVEWLVEVDSMNYDIEASRKLIHATGYIAIRLLNDIVSQKLPETPQTETPESP